MPAAPGYLKAAYRLCKKHNALFMDDEILAGCCRTGRFIAGPMLKVHILICPQDLCSPSNKTESGQTLSALEKEFQEARIPSVQFLPMTML